MVPYGVMAARCCKAVHRAARWNKTCTIKRCGLHVSAAPCTCCWELAPFSHQVLDMQAQMVLSMMDMGRAPVTWQWQQGPCSSLRLLLMRGCLGARLLVRLTDGARCIMPMFSFSVSHSAGMGALQVRLKSVLRDCLTLQRLLIS